MMKRFPTSNATGLTVFAVLLTLGMLATRRVVDQALAKGAAHRSL